MIYLQSDSETHVICISGPIKFNLCSTPLVFRIGDNSRVSSLKFKSVSIQQLIKNNQGYPIMSAAINLHVLTKRIFLNELFNTVSQNIDIVLLKNVQMVHSEIETTLKVRFTFSIYTGTRNESGSQFAYINAPQYNTEIVFSINYNDNHNIAIVNFLKEELHPVSFSLTDRNAFKKVILSLTETIESAMDYKGRLHRFRNILDT